MVNGFLMELEDRNCWTLAEAAGRLAAGHGPGGVVQIVDETADEKSSADCAGASRQYSGTVGGTALCQVMVTLTLASPDALIGRSLYLPEDWAADQERRELAGIPEEVMFATKPELAGELLQDDHDLGIRAGLVAGDEVCGGRGLRGGVRERGLGYVLAVRSNYPVAFPSGRLDEHLDRVGDARHYTRERATAVELQAGLLPRAIPEVPGLELACRYIPAQTGWSPQ
jgi:hypothetical protein